MSRLELGVLLPSFLIMLVGAITIFFIGCVRVTHRLPQLRQQFGDGEIPEEREPAKAICLESRR